MSTDQIIQITDTRYHNRRIIKEINLMSEEEFAAFVEADAQEYREYLADLQDLQATVGGR